jgi:type IV pilus assembly protein PilA
MRQIRGFTLLELMVVVLIIGILATIAIPKFASTKDRAYVATMKSDLRNLVTAEEAYQSDFATYTTSQPLMSYVPSSGVTVTITNPTATGWEAVASHNATSKTCGVYVGTGTPPIMGGQPGEAVCN